MTIQRFACTLVSTGGIKIQHAALPKLHIPPRPTTLGRQVPGHSLQDGAHSRCSTQQPHMRMYPCNGSMFVALYSGSAHAGAKLGLRRCGKLAGEAGADSPPPPPSPGEATTSQTTSAHHALHSRGFLESHLLAWPNATPPGVYLRHPLQVQLPQEPNSSAAQCDAEAGATAQDGTSGEA